MRYQKEKKKQKSKTNFRIFAKVKGKSKVIQRFLKVIAVLSNE
jgi:hypothetical protein